VFTGLVEGIAIVRDLKKRSKEVVLTFEAQNVDLGGYRAWRQHFNKWNLPDSCIV